MIPDNWAMYTAFASHWHGHTRANPIDWREVEFSERINELVIS